MRNRFSYLIWILLLTVPSGCRAQKQERQPDLQTYLQRLIQSNGSPLPKDDDLRVAHGIASTPADDIALALPTLMAALRNPNDMVKRYAVTPLYAISQRPDSAKLLSPYIESIAGLFAQEDPILQGIPPIILLNLKPQLPPEVVPPILSFVKRTDRDLRAQSSAISELLRKEPQNPAVIAATEEFLSRPLDKETREGALNGIANSGTTDARLVQVLIAALDSPDEGVRLTAAQAFWRMPKEAVVQARPALLKVAARSDESPEVKAAARRALGSANQQFAIVIGTEKPLMKLGSDVPIKIQVTNNSSQEINIGANISDLTRVDPNYTYEAHDSHGKPVALRRYPHPELAFGHAVFGTLKPGETVTTTQDISGLLNFSSPGAYTIQVSRRFPDPTTGSVVKSNKIVITLVR